MIFETKVMYVLKLLVMVRVWRGKCIALERERISLLGKRATD